MAATPGVGRTAGERSASGARWSATGRPEEEVGGSPTGNATTEGGAALGGGATAAAGAGVGAEGRAVTRSTTEGEVRVRETERDFNELLSSRKQRSDTKGVTRTDGMGES